MTIPDNQETFAAIWPGGVNAVPRIDPAVRPESLDSKTVGFLWDYVFRGEEIFPLIQGAIDQAYKDVRFVSYETFGSTFGGDEHQVLRQLPGKMRSNGIDVVISGIGC